jgi:ATP-dependent DNA helicase DinG
MAARIEQALGENGVFIGESGTGTGKTFAYLVPALRSKRRVLISTGTKNLQDQVFQRDLPLVRDLLGLPVAAALLKGRSNYLCLYRLERAEPDPSTRAAAGLARIESWARRTRSGDIAEADVAEEAEVWPLVTSTADNCLGSSCPHYERCYVNRARRQALDADVVVVNHYLFFADLVLREEGFGQLLPGADAVIFDEAHQLPEIATMFFGTSLGSHQLVGLCRDTIIEDMRERSGIPALRGLAGAVERALSNARLAFGVEPRREAWTVVADDAQLLDAFARLQENLAELAGALECAAGKGHGLASCARRAFALLERLQLFRNTEPSDHVHWFETTARGFSLYLTALDIAPALRMHLSAEKAWIFTSATLTVGKRFDHYQTRLGLEHADTGSWESPFDYRRQALLYIPADLPPPSAPDYTHRVVESAVPVLEASHGRAFMLFTSHRALRQASQLLPAKVGFPLLVQGSAPRTRLLEQFRATEHAVLLGTGSFWEGVDVRGEALSCVIIDKLPFSSPDDPVLRARCEVLARLGRSPFLEYQLPNAVISLKQGVGRLIRDERDRGLLMLCDPRLLEKAYGRVFFDSLPPMPLTRSLADVQSFFA